MMHVCMEIEINFVISIRETRTAQGLTGDRAIVTYLFKHIFLYLFVFVIQLFLKFIIQLFWLCRKRGFRTQLYDSLKNNLTLSVFQNNIS